MENRPELEFDPNAASSKGAFEASIIGGIAEMIRNRVFPDFSGFGGIPDAGYVAEASPARADGATGYAWAPEPPGIIDFSKLQ